MPQRTDYVVYLASGQPVCIARDIPRGKDQRVAIEAALKAAGVPLPHPDGPDAPLRWRPKSAVSQFDWLKAQGLR